MYISVKLLPDMTSTKIIKIPVGDIANGKPTKQQGAYNNQQSDLAVDGEVTTDDKKCAVPEASSTYPYRAWWSVDLQDTYTVIKLTLFNREDPRNDSSYSKLI